MSVLKMTTLMVFTFCVSGCSSIASSTNTLTDEKIKSESGGALGISPSQLTIIERRTEGTNTYVQLKTSNGQEYSCTINGGNLLSFGMTNPAMCSKKGEPVRNNPFTK